MRTRGFVRKKTLKKNKPIYLGIDKPIYIGYCITMSIKHEMDKSIQTLLEGLEEVYQESERLLSQKKNSAIKELNEKLYELRNEAQLLNFYNRHLYAHRGRASLIKTISSKENGKKGGRPPKHISEAKKQLEELRMKFIARELTPADQQEQERLENLIHEWKKSKT